MNLNRLAARIAKVFENQDAYDAYMKAHPDADKTNHSVAHPDTEPKEKTERLDHSKPVDMTDVEPPDDVLLELVEDDTSVVKDVVEGLASDSPPDLGDLFESLGLIHDVLEDDSWEKSQAEAKRLRELDKYLKEVIGLEDDEAKKDKSVSEGITDTKEDSESEIDLTDDHKALLKDFAARTSEEEYKKKKEEYDTEKKSALQAVTDAGFDKKVFSDIRSLALEAREKYEAALKKWNDGGQKGKKPTMSDVQAAWSKANPGIKVPEKVIDQIAALPAAPAKRNPRKLQEEFIDSLDDDDDKEFFEDLSSSDFSDILKSMSKKGSLRARTIRLAYTNPSLRPILLRALR